ncbi:MAG: response regulator [Deltaproteobacteria bacterium]|nr:MAG: response regulator [Deltaproteobacteria bacterium]
MSNAERTQPIILIVEDEAPIRRLLSALLASKGYRVITAQTAAEARIRASETPPDLLILDLGLPDEDGMELLRRLRSWLSAYVLVLSARTLEHEKVLALDEGANDYLTKPFGSAELLARIRVGLRATTATGVTHAVQVFDGLRIDHDARNVCVDGRPVQLTPLEFRLLFELARHAGKALTHRHLLMHVWGAGAVGRNHYVRVCMANLRAKLGDDPAQPRWIQTLPGIGYRMVAQDESDA